MKRRLAACLVLLAVTACGGHGTSGSGSGHPGTDPYSVGALEYGLAPYRHDGVTFQPDVVLVGGGGRSVHSVTADGLTWRLDARAPHVADLAVGKIMFVTGRGLGRVLALERQGDEVAVTVGPVDVTEVIRDGTFSKDEVPLDDVVTYPAGDAFWAKGIDQPLAAGGSGAPGVPGTTRVSVPLVDRPPAPSPQRRGTIAATSGDFRVFGSCCTDGAGVHFDYNKAGTKVGGTLTLTMHRPTAGFHLAIRGGSVTRAELTISGGFGFKLDVYGGTNGGPNIRSTFPVPGDFSFPIAQVLGVPLSFSVSQYVTVTTAFGARLGTITASGEYGIAGSLGYGYVNGRFGPRVTTAFQERRSLTDSIDGVSPGVMGLVVEHHVRFMVGFNAYVLSAGLYFDLGSSAGVTNGSALADPLVHCRQAGMGFHAAFGVGYSILEPVVKLINWFLDLVNIKPIRSRHGIQATAKIHEIGWVRPPVRACQS